MNSNTQPLYALTPITETEGLPNDQYRLVNKYGRESDVKYSFNDGKWLARGAIELYQFTHYLRPLPEGMVAVSPANLEDFIEWIDDNYEREHKEIRSDLWFRNEDALECSTKEVVAQFIQTKLAQMGECK